MKGKILSVLCSVGYKRSNMSKRKESPQYINNAEGKTRLFDAIVLNEAKIKRTSAERSVYCKGARAWNSLPPTERNLPCHELFKHHQKRNVKEITKNLPPKISNPIKLA